MHNYNSLAKMDLGMSYQKSDIQGYSTTHLQWLVKGKEIWNKLAKYISIIEQNTVVCTLLQAMDGLSKETNLHGDDTALIEYYAL